MINPVNLTMTSGGIDRHLSINPVYFQASPDEPVMKPENFLIYEEITPYEAMTDQDIADHLDRTMQPDYEPSEDLLYLGAIKFSSPDGMTWKWEGKSPGFSGEEMEALINFVAEYASRDADQQVNGNIELPMPPDTFTINIQIDGNLQSCPVSNWGEIFEIQLQQGYALLSIDENLIWRQIEGQPLPASLIDEIGYKINSFYE